MISESARMQVRTLIDVGIADAGEHEVKNIAEPVHAYRIVLDESAMPPAPRRVSAILRRPVIAAAITVLVVAVGGFAIWFATHAPAPTTEAVTPSDPILALPTGPSIAVLPFENLSGDTTQDYFSDGITEDIISALSRFRSMFVIGKDSTIRYKGSQASAKDIGGDLGVEFVLQGSVRRSGDVIRISTRLINAKDGSVVWSNVFDRPLDAENVFAIQDEITEQVVATLAGTFGVLDQTRYADTSGEPSQNLASYECVLRAKKFYFTWAVEMFLDARACLEGVIETEPEYADAWAWLALLVQEEYSNGFPEKPNAVGRSLEYAQKAIELAPNNQVAWVAMVEHHFFQGDFEQQELAVDRVIELNPNESFLVGAAAHFLCNAGNYERGLQILERAKLLSPYHAWWIHVSPARYDFDRQKYEDALVTIAKMGDVLVPQILVIQVASLAQLGRMDDARKALDALQELDTEYLASMRESLTSWQWTDQQIEHLVHGLRKAGLDIPDEPTAAG